MADNRNARLVAASRLLLARVRFAAMIALPLPKRASAIAPRLRVRSAIENRDAVQVPKGEFIEGRRAAAEALRTGFPVKCALIAEGGERDAALSRLVDDLNAAGVRIKYVPRAQLDALSSHGAHQGIAPRGGQFPPMPMLPISSTVRATVRRSSWCSTT